MGTREKLFRQKLANQIESLLTKSEKVFTSEKLSNEWLNSMLTETQELNSILTIYKFLHELPENEKLQVEFLELKDEETVDTPSNIPKYGEEILKEIDEFEAQEAIDVFETPDEKDLEPVSTNEPIPSEIVVEMDPISEEINEIEEIPDFVDQEIEENDTATDSIDNEETVEADIHPIASPIEEIQDDVNEPILDYTTPEADTKKEINDTVAIHETSLADKLRSNSIQKLADSIALNERFLFSNELFNGNMEAFKRALTELDHIASIADAQRYIDIQLKEENKWNMESETVERFVSLVKRRFN